MTEKLVLTITDDIAPRLVLCTRDGRLVPQQGCISFFQGGHTGHQDVFVTLGGETQKFTIGQDVIFDPDLVPRADELPPDRRASLCEALSGGPVR